MRNCFLTLSSVAGDQRKTVSQWSIYERGRLKQTGLSVTLAVSLPHVILGR